MPLSNKAKANKLIIEIVLWVLLVMGGYCGYINEGVLGLVCGVLVTFLAEALVVVPFYTLFKINARVKEMKELLEKIDAQLNKK